MAPGEYTLAISGFGVELPGLPDRWDLNTDKFNLAADQTRDIVLPPTSTLTVEVLGSDDSPIANTDVRLPAYTGSLDLGGLNASLFQQPPYAVTDGNGNASFSVFRSAIPSEEGEGSVEPPAETGYQQTIFHVPVIEQDTTVVVHPPFEATPVHLEGIVRDAAGDPVPEISVVAVREGVPRESAQTDAAGRYSLTMAPGEYTLAISGFGVELPGLPDRWDLNTDKFNLAADQTRDIVLPPTSTLTVEVLGSDDSPIANTDVRLPAYTGSLDLGGLNASLFQQPPYAVTDGNGNASFSVFRSAIPSEEGEGSVEPPAETGYQQTIFHVPVIEQDTTVVVHPPFEATPVHLEGIVRDAAGDPVPEISVVAVREGVPRESAQTDAAGRYSLTMAPGEYTLAISGFGVELPGLPDRWDLNTDKFNLAADQTRDIVLPPTSTLTVEVLGSDDSPIANTDVRLPAYTGSLDLGGLNASLFQQPPYAVTDGNGNASFSVFRSAIPSEEGEGSVEPPAETGYQQTIFHVPVIEQDTTVVVRFQSTAIARLAVNKTGNGSGVVTSEPAGINCGADCSSNFEAGSVVRLSAAEDSGSDFTGWTGCDSEAEGECVVTMSEARTVKAKFVTEAVPFEVIQQGEGTVECRVNGSNLGACPASASYGDTLTVVATPTGEAILAGFLGTGSASICSSSTCEFEITEASAVRVEFSAGLMPIGPPTEVWGEVPQTTSLESECTRADLGQFVPGIEANYSYTCNLTLTSTGTETILTAEDESETHTGHLVQGSYILPSALEARATDSEARGGGLGFTSLVSPVTLLTFPQPISKDNAALEFRQHIGRHDALHTGVYAKVITVTLEQRVP